MAVLQRGQPRAFAACHSLPPRVIVDVRSGIGFVHPRSSVRLPFSSRRCRSLADRLHQNDQETVALQSDGAWVPYNRRSPRLFMFRSSCRRSADRKSVVWGKSVSVSVGIGGSRIIQKKDNKQDKQKQNN